MSEKNISVLNDEDGFIIIQINGKEFVSTEPVEMIDGKFKGKDIQDLTFLETITNVVRSEK
jgi:hypothetical protein